MTWSPLDVYGGFELPAHARDHARLDRQAPTTRTIEEHLAQSHSTISSYRPRSPLSSPNTAMDRPNGFVQLSSR